MSNVCAGPGRNEVRWRPAAGGKFGAPMIEPKVFREQMDCTEESTGDIVGIFRRPPQWFGARGIVFSSLRPCAGHDPHELIAKTIASIFHC